MSQAIQSPPAGFDELSVDQQVDYVQTLWDRIAAREPHVPLPDWHQEVLAERLAEHQADPEAGRPWEHVEADLRARFAGRR